MAEADDIAAPRSVGPFEPLREPFFRNIWSASLLSNFGQMILGVGAAWEMTRLTNSPEQVALVQTALMVPLMLVAVPAGAIADMFDRRKIALVGLAFSTCCAALLTMLAGAGLTTPWVLLLFCTLIGSGVALYSPAWQASIREQVTPERLPAAVALGSISYNLARSVGPAVGGIIVLMVGAIGAYAINAVCYLPLMLAFFFWKREAAPSRLPPERIDRAIISGTRYAIHSPPVRIAMIRIFIFCLAGAAPSALTPLIAKDLLGGNASTFGLLLGASGAGAVVGALLVGKAREHLKAEHAARLCALTGGLGIVTIGLSHHLALTTAAMFVAGAASMLKIALLNVGVQLAVPRWVTARALAWYSASLAGGIALGAWITGYMAGVWDVTLALYISGGVLAITPVLGLVWPVASVSPKIDLVEIGNEPEVAMAITSRSGPIVIEVDYEVDPGLARQFYDKMLKLQRVRLRNGGFDWSITRDIADPARWTERYHFPTWGDYLHSRSRFTEADQEIQKEVDAFHEGVREGRVRRRLERPFGSVRWRADSPDPHRDDIGFFAP